MKKFFKFGKSKKDGSETASRQGSIAGSSRQGSIAGSSRQGSVTSLAAQVIGGYEVREKDLGKLHKAAWTGDLNKVKQLAKKDVSSRDKENRCSSELGFFICTLTSKCMFICRITLEVAACILLQCVIAGLRYIWHAHAVTIRSSTSCWNGKQTLISATMTRRRHFLR